MKKIFIIIISLILVGLVVSLIVGVMVKERQEEIEIPAPILPNNNIRDEERLNVTRCQTDADCRAIFCPMAIGIDTPRCNIDIGECYCGPSDEYLRREQIETPEPMPAPGY